MENENETTALATREMIWNTPERIDLLKRTVAVNATDDELALFLHTCQRTGLDPIARQIHFVKRKAFNTETKQWEDRGTIQMGIDGFRVIASRTGELAGIDDPVFEMDGGVPIKATVTVYRFVNGEKCAFSASARWSEYVQTTKEGVPTRFWKKMPFGQLGKCAESLALRKAFPADLSGMYTREEMGQAENDAHEERPTKPTKRYKMPSRNRSLTWMPTLSWTLATSKQYRGAKT